MQAAPVSTTASTKLLLSRWLSTPSVHAARRDARVARLHKLPAQSPNSPLDLQSEPIMSKTPPTAGQTLYRLSVMVGTLSIGSMAAYLYGPPPEKLASLINTAANSFAEMAEHRNSAPGQAEPSYFAGAPTTPSTVAPGSLYVASETSPIATPIAQPVTSLEVATKDPAELLRQAGATESTVTPWGSVNATTGQSLYRAAATVPVGPINGSSGGNGLVERLDAIGETPEKAVEALLAQMNQIRR